MAKKAISGVMLTLLILSMFTLTFNVPHVEAPSPEVPFFDDFNDGVADGWTQWLGTWYVDNREYVAFPVGYNATSTVNGLDLTDCVIETRLRFQDTQVPFTAGIIFKWIGTGSGRSYYSFDLGKDYNKAWLIYHDREEGGGTGWTYLASADYQVEANVNYTLKVEVNENTFTCYVNGTEVFAANDEHLTIGKVGLNAHSFISGASAFFDDFKVLSISRIVVPDDYPTIQDAINHANEGDTIYVKPGTYYEHIIVNKTVSLIGENRSNTILDGGNGAETVVRIISNNVFLKELSITHGSSGISVYGANNVNIARNHIFDNQNYGIFVGASVNISIYENLISHSYYGFDSWMTGQIKMRNNSLVNNRQNFGIYGYWNKQDIDASNTVDGKPIYYWIGEKSRRIPDDAGYVALVLCSNITVENVSISNNTQGILLVYTDHTAIRNSTFHDCPWGVELRYSSRNSIGNNLFLRSGLFLDLAENNTVVTNDFLNENPWQGLWVTVQYGKGNHIYHNNFVVAGSLFVESVNANDTWDNGSEGNYWNAYNGTDSDGDGIGDTLIPWMGVDNYPLMNRYWNPSDVNHDLKVDIKDLAYAAKAYGSYLGGPRWNPSVDLNNDNRIDIKDLALIAKNYGKTYV